MTQNEILLVCLMEECSEVSQRVSKLLRFGACEIEPGRSENNKSRLESELIDLLSVIQILGERGMIEIPSLEIPYKLTEVKREKIGRYLSYSRDLGICG